MGCIPILPVKHYGDDDDVARCEWAFKDPTPSGTTYIPVFCRLLLRSLEILNPPKPLLFLSPAEIFFVSWKPYTLLITATCSALLHQRFHPCTRCDFLQRASYTIPCLVPPAAILLLLLLLPSSRRPPFNILCIYSVSDPDSDRWSSVRSSIHLSFTHPHPYLSLYGSVSERRRHNYASMCVLYTKRPVLVNISFMVLDTHSLCE